MFTRWQKKRILDALKVRRAVHLTGARQCGKTTLAESLSLPKARHFSLDNETYYKSATSDPIGLVARNNGETIIIDEVQKVPSLMNAIKIQLDHSNEKGQYLLTGSSNIHFTKDIRDSLAGRLCTIRLHTLTQGEVNGGKGAFLARAFQQDFPSTISGYSKREVIRMAFSGGYPEARELDADFRREWFRGYLNDLLIKDVQDITQIRKIESLQKVAFWLFAHSGKFFDLNGLCTQAQISKETAQSYIEALKALFLFDAVAPWSKSDYARIGKRLKYYASDPAFIANLLQMNEESAYLDDDISGKLVETWVYHELSALIDLTASYSLTQYRDSNKHEIDFLIENDAGTTLAIEVKAGSVVGASDFKHIKWFAKTFTPKTLIGIVLYSGTDTVRFGDGLYAVPLGALAI